MQYFVAITCAAVLVPANPILFACHVQPQPVAQDAVKIPAEELDSLVAPIALYPDSLLSQTLVASTYPLELIQLQQWLQKNQNLAGDQQKLADAVKHQPWDPSIQAMAALPDVVKRLADDIQWTTDLGNAFLAQQSDVMDAIQRMRDKAKGTGALVSNQQQTVVTQVIESKQVIVIQQANPKVVYVPVYSPVIVYGPPIYPYPPIYYPPSTGAVIAAAAISFGVGWAIGAAWRGGWGWGCGWGRRNTVNININNNFNRNININTGNRTNINRGNTTWQHNPAHRGGAPYGDRATANRFGGTARADSLQNRQRAAQRDLGRQGGTPRTADNNRAAAGDRGAVGNRGGLNDRSGGSNRGAAGVSNNPGVSRPGGAGVNDRSRGGVGSSGGSGDRVGNRWVGSDSGRDGAFGGAAEGRSGSNARASSSRGSSSMSRAAGGEGGARTGGTRKNKEPSKPRP